MHGSPTRGGRMVGMDESEKQTAEGAATWASEGDAASQAIRDSVAEWLMENVEQPDVCPGCGTSDWASGEPVGLPLEAGYPAKRYVLVPVVCTKCGHTRLHHTDTMFREPDP